MASPFCEPLVLGAFLRVDVAGWGGPPPALPRDPIAIEDDRSTGKISFVYDLLPNRACLPVGDACQRVSAILLSLLEHWPFRDLPFPARCRLDLGLVVDDPASTWRVDFPSCLFAALADADVGLGLSVYPGGAEQPAES